MSRPPPQLPDDNSAAASGDCRRPGSIRPHLPAVALAVLSLIIAWVCMADISRTDPWYRNTDMNIHNMVDALSINSDVSPHGIDQPGVPLKSLLALDFRIRHYLGLLPVWNVKKFSASADPLREIPALIHVERVHSRILVMALILSAAWLIYSVTRELESACFTVVLLCGSSGLLFHGLLTRPELLCVGFGNILALHCAWRSTTAQTLLKRHAWLFLAGLFCGLSAFDKLPGMCYLALCYGWCWAAVLTAPASTPEPAPDPGNGNFWTGLLPAAAGLSILGLLFMLTSHHDALGSVVIQRLRVAAVAVAVAPMLSLCPWSGRRWRFLHERGHELVVLVAGALAAIPVTFLFLGSLMTAASASDYLTGTLHFLVNPAPTLKYLLATEPDFGREFMRFFKETPLLYVSATLMAVVTCLLRPVPLRLKTFSVLLLAVAYGMVILMSRRQFFHHYSIFPTVPLVLVCSLGAFGLKTWWQAQPVPEQGGPWIGPLFFTAAFAIMIASFFQVQGTYAHNQDDADLPVRDLTLTFLFDHDVHTRAYLHTMEQHYGNREQFARALDRYLADPSNRY